MHTQKTPGFLDSRITRDSVCMHTDQVVYITTRGHDLKSEYEYRHKYFERSTDTDSNIDHYIALHPYLEGKRVK